jgi:hypothetical protein
MKVKELKKILKKFKDNDEVYIVRNWDNVDGEGHPELEPIGNYQVIEPEYIGWESYDNLSVRTIYFYGE